MRKPFLYAKKIITTLQVVISAREMDLKKIIHLLVALPKDELSTL
jgi:hypothetical protein